MKSLLAILLFAFATSAPASGWFTKVDSNCNSHEQCNILLDQVQAAPGQCYYRLSAMCLINGQGSAAGVGNWDSPIVLPYTMLLLSTPYGTPVGSVTVAAVPATGNATIGVNGAPPTSDWARNATYTGSTCAGSSPSVKPSGR